MRLARSVGGLFVMGAALLCVPAVGYGQNFVKPNDTVTFEIEIENEAPSTATAQGVRITPIVENAQPAELAGHITFDEQGSVLGPETIEVGAALAKTFRVKVVIGPNAPDGTFDVRAKVSAESGDELLVSPDPDVLDVVTSFEIRTPAPTVTIRDALEPLFNQLQGTAIITPATLFQTAVVTVHDDAGVASVTLPGSPATVEVLTPPGAPLSPVPDGTKDLTIKISSLPTGIHAFSVTNKNGKVTSGTWKVDALALRVNSSVASYDSIADAFTGTIELAADSTVGTEQVVQFNPTTQIVLDSHPSSPFPISASNLDDSRFFYMRDKSGNAVFQDLYTYQSAISSTTALQTNGDQPASITLSFATPGHWPLSGQSAHVKPGVIRNTMVLTGAEQSGELTPAAVLEGAQQYGTYRLEAGGQLLISGSFSSSGDTQVHHITTLSVPDDITFTLTMTKAPFVGVSRGNCLDTVWNPTCSRPKNMVASVFARPVVRALAYTLPAPDVSPHIRVFAGPGQAISLGSGVSLNGFNATGFGYITRPSLVKRTLEPGYINLLGDQEFEIRASSEPVFYDPAFTLTLPFDGTKHTADKTVFLARLDICDLMLFQAAVSTDNKATAPVNGFGKYAVVEKAFATPREYSSGACHFMSDKAGLAVTESNPDARYKQAVNVIGSLGYAPVGTTCDMSPSGTTFTPPGAVKLCFSPADLEKAGVSNNPLTLFQFSKTGVREELANMFIDRERGIVAGTVDRFSSEFGVFASSPATAVLDLLPPLSTLSVDGQAVSTATLLVVNTTSTLALTAVDLVFPGAPTSGVAGTFILVDEPFVDFSSTPGLPYSGPFNLSVGTHTLAFYSTDAAGNRESMNVVNLLANPPPSRGVAGLAVGRDSTNRLWTVALDDGAVTLARTDAGGVMVASAPLPQALSGGRWNLLFDEAGGVYAVGAAEGPSTQASDVAVYKAAPEGGALASSGYFDGGFGGADFVFDAAAPGWIAGAVEVSGGVLKAALWRFDPAGGAVTLSTAFASGAAMGVAVDADGSVWTSGYVWNPSPRSSRVYDLGLWHFASDGQTLLAGPYTREAYATDIEPTFAAEIQISSGTVTVVAPRGRAGGGTDLGSVRFDKASGAVLAENAWRAADGSAAYPAAVLPDGEGILAAGGLDAGVTRAALWRFGADGGLASATLADAGGARGASAAGADLWLAVDDATAPYKVTSESALAGSLSDVRPPRVDLAVGAPSFVSGGGAVFVASASLLNFTSTDDKLASGDGLGAGVPAVYYRADSTGAFAAFSGPFSLAAEGAHAVEFYGVDSADNPGPILLRSIAVDATAPVTQAFQNGAETTLEASDPNGAGVSRIRYLVDYGDPAVCNSVAEDTSAARGTCENPWYAGSFTLSNGPHTLHFQAFDAVGNAEVLRATYPFVEAPGTGPSAGGMGIGKDAFDAFWTVVSENNTLAFAHSDSSGALISSSTLQDATAGFPWSVFFGPDGRAYAVGGAAGPATQALDLAVYKASPEGDAVEFRTLFDSGYANNDIAFDAKAPGWIVGAAQTSGPTDLEAAGPAEFSMALWRFDPAHGTIQLKTTSARAGFDLGAGLAVDADGSLWIAGYSLGPAAPAVGGFDLALWHYAADGQTVLGGPFLRQGYLNDIDGGFTARVFVSSQAVYVATPRANVSGGTDMAFLRYDKASGLPTSEIAWRSADGAPSYPIAVLPEASGILVAGGIGGEFTEAGLWRFGFDGALRSVTTADAGAATGAVFRGSELWLSVDGSTVPYRVDAEVAAAGSLVDLVAPRTSLSAGVPSSIEAQTVYVTSATPLGFAVADDYAALGDGLGVGATQTFYAEAGGAYSRFTSSFTLVAEGTHTISFFSIDLEGRVEAVKTQSVGVDLTAPVVTFVSSGSLFSIVAVDPVVGGAASGVGQVQYLVDQDPECNVAQSTAAPPGTCENSSYAGPFELAVGTHTVYYAANDRVLNGAEVAYSSFVTVAPPPSAVTDLALSSIGLSTVTLQWTAPASPSGAVASYEIRYASFPLDSGNFASGTPVNGPAPAPVGTGQSASIDGLDGVIAFYAALKSRDVYGNASALSNVASWVRGTAAVGDQPEFTFSANVAVTAVPVSTFTAPGTVVLATATAQGLTLVSSIYDLGPEGTVFNPYARMTFVYSPVALASLGLLPGDIKIYQYVSGIGMVAVSSQTVDAAANTITGYVPSLSSIFAVFGVVKDRAAPVTSLTPGASVTFADVSGNLYASPAASFGFSAYDPVVFGIASGVARTNYRVDGASTAPFSLYTSTFSLSAEGQRTLWFYSEDHAGNVEVVRSSGILVDAFAPVTTLQVIGSSVAGVSGGLAVSSTTTIALSAADPVSSGVASGVSGIFYALDADPASPYAGPFALPPGAHSLSYFSKDNVANAETANVLSVLVDTAAPRSILLVDGVPATAPGVIIVSTNSLGFSASDMGAGVAQILYSLDGAGEQVYVSTFSPSAGSHTLAYRGVDRLGNAEIAHQVALDVFLYDVTPPSVALSIVDRSTITTDSPFIAATYGDDGRGVDVSTVRLTLDGADMTAQAAVTSSSTTFSPTLTQGAHVLSISFADFAGNQASAAASFFVDSLPPATILQVNGVAASTTALVVVSTDSLGFAALDAGVGVAQTVYSLNGGAPIVYVSTFSLAAGAHTLAYHSVDRAGNIEASRDVSLTVLLYDVAPPSVVLTPASGSTVTTATPLIAAVYSDAGRGVDVSSVRVSLDGLDVTYEAAVSASSAVFIPSAALSQAAHAVVVRVSDLSGNQSVAASTFLVDSLPPVTTLLVDGLATSATSLVLISTDSIGFSALDAGVGAAETRYALDGSTSEVVYVSPFSLAAGVHTLAFHSRDFAGNVEAARTVSIAVLADDTTPPSLALAPVDGGTITTTTPEIRASYSDPGRGVDLSSVRISLDGQDVTPLASIGASSAAFTPAAALSQGTHTVTATVSDLAGNAAFALATFHIDSLPPMTTLLVNGLATGSANLILASTDAVSFAAADSGVGVLETRYSVDGSSETVFAAPFFLSPGSSSLAFRSRDRAGNQEAIRTVLVAVTTPSTDTTPPLVRLDLPGASALGVEQALGGVVDVRGAVSDASALAWTLEAAPGASAAGGFATIASGAGSVSGLIAAWNTTSLSGYQTVRLRATDAFGNSASATATVFVGGPVFTFAVGRKDSHVIVNTIKGPTGIAVRSDGAVWVASTENDKILLLSPAGVLLGEAGHAPGHSGREKKRGKKDKDHDDGDEDEDSSGLSFKTPQGLTLDAADNLYVADRDLNRVLKLSPDGRVLLLQLGKAGSGNGELRHPFDVAVDGNGDIYIADSGNRRIQVFNSSGGYLRQFGQGVLLSTSEVRGITLTAEGLWVSDKEQERVFLFSRAGVLLKSIGGADSAVGELSRMRGLASDRLGALYVVEPNRDRVQKFDPRGKGLLAFGSKAGLSQADKKAKRYLTQPIDAAMAPDGSLWITDTGRDRIVRYALPSSGGYAARGGEFSSSSAEPARRIVDHKDGAKVERDDGAGVSVPKGALAADLEITVEKGDENQDKEQKTAKRRKMKIAAVSEEVQYGPEGTTFAAPVTLILPYDADLLASQGILEDDLKVYYWNPTLKDWQAMPSTVDKQNKTVHAQTTHFSAYQVGGLGGIGVAAVDDFGLRDGYAFPNPSRNGSAVTFRIQPGSVDSIEVRVYDLSGRKVHSSSDFRFLGAIDDGNGKGAQNTYDHVWNVSGVGSGVYTFVMTARKAGQPDIRKTGKVGIIR